MKNLEKSLISTLKEIKNNLSRDTDTDLASIWEACTNYGNKTQDRSLEDVFDEYLSSDIAEDYLKRELENGGIFRLYHAMGNCRGTCDYYRLNAYGNLENIDKEDIECLIDEIIDRLEE